MEHWPENTTQKMKVSIKDLFSKYGQILGRKLHFLWSDAEVWFEDKELF